MVQPQVNLGSTSKTLNLYLLEFNEWSGSENLTKQGLQNLHEGPAFLLNQEAETRIKQPYRARLIA